MSHKPSASRSLPYIQHYMTLAPDLPLLECLAVTMKQFESCLQGLTDEKSQYRYADGKWNITEIIGHMIDVEVVMNYRAYSISRGEQKMLPGYEQDDYVNDIDYSKKHHAALMRQLRSIRAGSIATFETMSESELDREGTYSSSNNYVTARITGYILCGHMIHHINVLNERYSL